MNTAVLLIGAYAWLSTILLGMTVLDVALAGGIRGAGSTIGPSTSREIADLLLLVMVLTITAGLLAVAAAWQSRTARGPLSISVVLAIGLVVGPPLLAGPIEVLEAAIGIALGPLLRLAWGISVSGLALLALRRI